MSEITLEKVDQIRERTGVSYAVAKEALEHTSGNVLDALIYLEESAVVVNDNFKAKEDSEGKGVKSVEEFKTFLKELIEKGNVSRIKIKKEDQTLVDVPVNAGIAATVIAIVLPPVLAFGVIAAVATKITIEITKADGSVEVINQYVKKAYDEAKDKASEVCSTVKEKISEVKDRGIQKGEKGKVYTGDETVYTYTVKFDEE